MAPPPPTTPKKNRNRVPLFSFPLRTSLVPSRSISINPYPYPYPNPIPLLTQSTTPKLLKHSQSQTDTAMHFILDATTVWWTPQSERMDGLIGLTNNTFFTRTIHSFSSTTTATARSRTISLTRKSQNRKFIVSASKEGDTPKNPKLDRLDQMELNFGQLLGEDPKLTLAKVSLFLYYLHIHTHTHAHAQWQSWCFR